jgi:hypothetical protein
VVYLVIAVQGGRWPAWKVAALGLLFLSFDLP